MGLRREAGKFFLGASYEAFSDGQVETELTDEHSLTQSAEHQVNTEVLERVVLALPHATDNGRLMQNERYIYFKSDRKSYGSLLGSVVWAPAGYGGVDQKGRPVLSIDHPFFILGSRDNGKSVELLAKTAVIEPKMDPGEAKRATWLFWGSEQGLDPIAPFRLLRCPRRVMDLIADRQAEAQLSLTTIDNKGELECNAGSAGAIYFRPHFQITEWAISRSVTDQIWDTFGVNDCIANLGQNFGLEDEFARLIESRDSRL